LDLVTQVIASKVAEPSLKQNSKMIDLVGESSFVQQMRKQISIIGPRNAWVLITGENGSGKEVVAQMIHAASPRSAKPFVAINCAAIPDELIESELFGHEKGAFTSAVNNRRGKFEQANLGTLFLDEIGDMSLKTQAKILRILQEKVFERVGGDESIATDVRIIAATNKDLVEEIKQGRFREDLYYRLNVIPLKMMPLRERREDILPLAKNFLVKLSDSQTPKVKLSEFAEKILVAHDWPGNVRELKNAIERAVILSDGVSISASDFTWLGGSDTSESSTRDYSSLKQAKSDFERTYILGKLEEYDWNVSKTAESLGIERSNLHRKLRAYDIDSKKLKG
jgi:two-component system nitrogen regulation response regulator NtrX